MIDDEKRQDVCARLEREGSEHMLPVYAQKQQEELVCQNSSTDDALSGPSLKAFWENVNNSRQSRELVTALQPDIESLLKEYDAAENTNENEDEIVHFLYRVHSRGHQILISQYSESGQGNQSVRATKDGLEQLICEKKEPIYIDVGSLSKVQFSSLIRTLSDIECHIEISNVNKGKTKAVIVKYKE